jgi:hypothetical protein
MTSVTARKADGQDQYYFESRTCWKREIGLRTGRLPYCQAERENRRRTRETTDIDGFEKVGGRGEGIEEDGSVGIVRWECRKRWGTRGEDAQVDSQNRRNVALFHVRREGGRGSMSLLIWSKEGREGIRRRTGKRLGRRGPGSKEGYRGEGRLGRLWD